LFIEGKIEELTGYSKEDLIKGHVKLEDLIYDDDKIYYNEILNKLFTIPNTSYQFSFRIRRKDDKIRWVQRIAENVVDEKGEILYVHGITYDITNLKFTQQKLQELYYLNDLIINNIDNGVIGVSINGEINFINNTAISLLNLNSNKVIGENIHNILHSKHVPKDKCLILSTIKKGEPLFLRNEKFKTNTGEEIEVELSVNPLKQDGNVIGGILCFKDIKERKEFEEEILKLINLINQAEVSIVITDLDANIIYVNDAFEKITGYTFEEVFGENPRVLKSGMHDENFYKELWDTITAGETWKGRFINKRKDGSLYHEDAVIFPLKNLDGEIVNYAGIKKDITKEVELEEQIKMTQKLEAMGQMVGGVAHDFNNILTVINGYAELMQMKVEKSSSLYKPLEEIQNSVERAKSLINQLLLFSRKKIIEPKKLNLNNIITNMQKMLKRLISEDIKLNFDLSDDDIFIWADQTQIEQIILNLVVNARDAIYALEKPVTKEITISVYTESVKKSHKNKIGFKLQKGDYAKITVKDTGIGMDKEIMSKIFEPFFTTKETGKGTGLGLSTVYGIVTAHKGAIDVESTLGKGTSFHIYLPLYNENINEIIDNKNSSSKVELDKKFSETVLVVEDEESLLKVISSGLEQIGYNVITATNGREGIEKYRENRDKIDIIISDIVMPELDGFEFYKNILKLNKDIKFIFTTGYTDRDFSEIENKANVLILNKPFNLVELNSKIRELLDK
jgi:two-component system cell cycle sensor histidine kinase/response regulator CckA